MGTRRLLLVGLALSVMGLMVYAENRDRSLQGVHRWESPVLEPHAITLAPGIHLLGGLAPAAAYVVETSDGLVTSPHGCVG